METLLLNQSLRLYLTLNDTFDNEIFTSQAYRTRKILTASNHALKRLQRRLKKYEDSNA